MQERHLLRLFDKVQISQILHRADELRRKSVTLRENADINDIAPLPIGETVKAERSCIALQVLPC